MCGTTKRELTTPEASSIMFGTSWVLNPKSQCYSRELLLHLFRESEKERVRESAGGLETQDRGSEDQSEGRGLSGASWQRLQQYRVESGRNLQFFGAGKGARVLLD